MALFIVVDETDRASAVRLVGSSAYGEGFHTSSAAMSGTVESGLIEIEDSAGALDIKGWRSAYIIESTASPQRIWTGFIANVDQTAGSFKTGAGRVHQCETVDLNWNLTRKAIETGGKRPAETDLARATWILGHSTLSGLVYSGALTDLTNNPVNVDEADYTDQYPIDVLADICPVSGKTAYVTWDYTNNRPQLFYDLTTTSTYDSPAAISDVLADSLANPTTVFAPRVAPVLHRVIEDAYSDVWLRYVGGIVHVHSAAFETAHARRDLVLTSSRIGRLATANTYVALYGANHAQEVDSLECEVELAAAHVNDIMEGHRIYFKSSHLSGYTSYAYTRVERRTVRQVDDQATRFVLGLQLSDRVLSALPGGPPPSGFPNPPPSSPSIVQSSEGLSNRTFASAPAAGDTLIYVGGRRHDTFNATGINTYTIGPDGEAVEPTYDDRCAVFHRIADGTESATLITGDQNGRGVWLEFDGEWTVDAHAEATNNLGGGPSTGSPTAGAITVAPNSLVFAVVAMGEGGGWDAGSGSIHFTPPAGFTELSDGGVFDGHPSVWVGYLFSAAGGSISAAPTCTNASIAWATQIVSFVGANGPTPPAPGQWVYDEVPTPVADGTTTTFTLANTFADGSLLVKVDRLDQTAAVTSYDGTAGTFTLGFAPRTGELIEVTYQGR